MAAQHVSLVIQSVPSMIKWLDMNRYNIFVLFVAAAMSLSACDKNLGLKDAGHITIDASIGSLTKVVNDDAESSFEAGDKIAVYAWTGDDSAVPAERVVDGVVNTLGSDGKWTPATQMRWKPGSDAHYFLGISPVHAISDFTADAFTLSGTFASDDLLVARNLDGVKPGSGVVALRFEHILAKLTVNLRIGTEFGASPAVSVSVTAKSGATVNYLAKTVSASGNASAQSLTAATSAASGYTHSFSGIQVPQDGVKVITVSVNGEVFIYEAGEDIPLVTGHTTTLGLLIGKDLLEFSGISVSPWGDGGDFLMQADQVIVFEDSGLKSYLVATDKIPVVDRNRDGQISMAEAAAVPSLGTLFDTGSTTGRSYTRFNEFQYFIGITELPDESFNNWTSLESITLPESIMTIGGGRNGDKGIFQNCPKLKTIAGKYTQNNAIIFDNQLLRVAPAAVYDGQFIPDGVEIIGNKALSHSITTDLIIPSSVKTIRDGAFEYSAIVSIFFKGEEPPTVETGAFENTSPHTITIYVPAVMNGTSVDVDASNARIAQFETAMGMGSDYFFFQYYTSLPSGTYNDHEFVDMGHGLLWATCNIGAENPWDYGDYFAWGETEPYYESIADDGTVTWKEGKEDGYIWTSYSFSIDSYYTLTKYCNDIGCGYEGFTDNLTTLEPGDDAATTNWGGKWRMPTYAEWEWLMNNADWVWTDNYNGSNVKGMLVTSRVNGNSIFLPAAGFRTRTVFQPGSPAGYYWSSSLSTRIEPNTAWDVCFSSDSGFSLSNDSRVGGDPVRPVLAF